MVKGKIFNEAKGIMQKNIVPTGVKSNEMAGLIEENLSAKSMSFAKLPGGSLRKGNPAWFTSGLKRAGYNGITRAEFNPQEIDQQIEESLMPFKQSGTPLTWWVGPLSAPGNLGRALQTRGFFHNRDMIGMAACLDSLSEFSPPELDYHFEPVLSRNELDEWMPLFMQTFGVPPDDSDLVHDALEQLSFSPDSEWRHYLIRVNGNLVATSSLHLGAGVAGLYNIATQPEYRKHGLGAAITWLTFEQAREMGFTLGTLQTTYPNALRLYHRMGFEVYCKIGIYQRGW
jgi:GNAT superfamily N-acetyltransferase